MPAETHIQADKAGQAVIKQLLGNTTEELLTLIVYFLFEISAKIEYVPHDSNRYVIKGAYGDHYKQKLFN